MNKSKKTSVRASDSSAMQWADRRANDPAHMEAINELMTEMDLQQDLMALREERGITQVELAVQSGLTQSTISKIESGRVRNLELKTIVRIAAALGVRVRIMFEPIAGAAKTKAKNGRKRQVA